MCCKFSQTSLLSPTSLKPSFTMDSGNGWSLMPLVKAAAPLPIAPVFEKWAALMGCWCIHQHTYFSHAHTYSCEAVVVTFCDRSWCRAVLQADCSEEDSTDEVPLISCSSSTMVWCNQARQMRCFLNSLVISHVSIW